MGSQYSHIGPAKRDRIAALRNEGHSLRTIAVVLGLSHSTLSRELRRNSYGTGNKTPPAKHGVYDPSYAQHKAYVRRHESKYQGMKIERDRSLRAFVIRSLKAGWNPDEIAGYLKRHQECPSACGEEGCGLAYISKTAFYDWLRSPYGQPWCQYLPSRRYQKKRYRQQGPKRVLIPDRTGIDQRPEVVASRTEPGHWEGDTVVSGKRTGSKAALAVFVERETRLVTARLMPDLRPRSFTAAATSCLAGKQTLTLTLDNGQENRRHQAITAATGAQVYFADPYSSWQKGSVEHANKLLRYDFPKGCDLGMYNQAVVDAAVDRLNKKPRKILGYKSALQLAVEKGVFTSRDNAYAGGALEG